MFTTTPPTAKFLNHFLPVFTTVIVAATALVTIYVRLRVVYFAHPDVGGVENNVIYSILRLIDGYPLYEDPAVSPFAITQYSPIYYQVVAGIARITNVSTGDVFQVYVLSRWVSLAANLLLVGGVVQLARVLRLPVLATVLAGMLTFVFIAVQSYGRPDSLSNALVIWTIYTLTQWRFRMGFADWPVVVVSAFLTALALFTKQSALSLPLLVIGYSLIVARDWRKAGIYSTGLLLFMSINYLVLVRVDIHLFWDNIIKGVSNGVDLDNFRHNLINHYLLPYSWLVILTLFINWYYWKQHDSNRRILAVASTFLFVFACVTGLKQGAALNYFSEFTTLGVLISLDFICWHWKKQINLPVWSVVGLYMIVGIMTPINSANFNWKLVLFRPVSMDLYQQDQNVAAFITDSLHIAPSDRIYTTFHNTCFLNTLLYKYTILPQQDIVKDAAYPRHTFDYTLFDKETRNGKIRYVISDVNHPATAFKSINLAMYHPVKQIGAYTIFSLNTL